MSHRVHAFLRVVAVLAVASLGIQCFAASDVLLGRVVPPSLQVPAEQIAHSKWNSLLVKYVDERGMVDYTTWKATTADVTALDAYIDHLSTTKISPKTPADVKLAFWINAYNAVTVKGILREYPTSSIRNHTAKLYGYNIWKNLKLRVDGNAYSLDQMEHEILRKMGEPRIHFAIVCASIGCPKLANEAYVAERIDEQLTRNAKDFFADQQKFEFDPQRRTLNLSPILKWFAEDFGNDQAAQLRAIAPYLPDARAQQLATSGDARVSYLEYDWGLNVQAKVRSARR